MHNAQITRLRGELAHIDAVLRLFDPDTDPADVPPYRRWPRKTKWFARGEIAQRVYEASRTGDPVSPTRLADHAIKAKGLEDVRWKTRRDIVSKFPSMLYTMTRRGQLTKVGRGPGVRWVRSPTEPDLI